SYTLSLHDALPIWRHELRRRTRLSGDARWGDMNHAVPFPFRRLIRMRTDAAEDRHHDQPSIGELVVAHDGVAVVGRLARAGEAGKHGVVGHGAGEHRARRAVLLPLLGEDRHARIHRLHDVVGADREAVVRRVAKRRRSLRAFEPETQTIETL